MCCVQLSASYQFYGFHNDYTSEQAAVKLFLLTELVYVLTGLDYVCFSVCDREANCLKTVTAVNSLTKNSAMLLSWLS